MNIKRLFVRAFWVGFLLLLCVLPAAAQSNLIEITPSTGLPGSTVVIRDLGGNRGKTCFMSLNDQATSIGTMAGSITFVIPTFAPPGALIEFLCTGGSDGVRSNTVIFSVAGGITPTPAILTLTDSDGDGIVDVSDACPTVAGIPEQNGCPLTLSPEPPPIVVDPPLALPDLPTTGACVLATLDADPVNIRQGTSTDTPIVGQIGPLQLYTVIGRNADSSWFQLDGGWVAGFVTRRGGDCTTLPQTDGIIDDFAIEQPQESLGGLLLPAVQRIREAPSRLQNCPNLAPAVDALPNFLALYIISEPDPCAAAQAELDGLFLAGAQQPLSNQDLFDSCNGLTDFEFYLYFYYEFMDRLHDYAPDTWQIVNSSVPDDLPCTYVLDLVRDGQLPASVPDAHVAPFATAYCMFGDMTQGWFNKTVGFMNFIGFRRDSVTLLESEDQSADDTCAMIAFIRTVGTVYPSNVELYQFLHNTCLNNPAHAAYEAIYQPVREALDAGVQLNNCGGTDDSQPLPPDLQPMIPSVAQGATCIGNFRLLATYNQSLGMEMLYRMLVAPNPCQLAWEYSRDGYVASISGLPAPDCVQGDELVLTGTANQRVVLNQQSPWREKLMVLDRPFNQVCAWITLPGQGDSFAPNPTSVLGSDDLAIAPTATPLGFVIAPSATPLGLVLAPTLVPTVADPPADQPPADQPPADNPQPDQPSDPPQPVPNPEQPTDPAAAGQGTGANETISIGSNSTETAYPGADQNALALYVGTNAQGEDSVYVLTSVSHTAPARYPLHFHMARLDNYPVSLSPDGQYAIYFAPTSAIPTEQARQITVVTDANNSTTPPTEAISLIYHKIDWASLPDGGFNTAASLEGSVVLNFPAGLTPAPYAPFTLPEVNDEVLVLFANGIASLYQLTLNETGDIAVAQLLVENATAPAVSPDGRYIAFERADTTGRNLYVMSTNSRAVHPITQQQGSECYAPQFGTDSLTLFFTCEAAGERKIFRYGISGVTELALGIPSAGNPMPSTTPGFITFDDGQTIYIAREDGSQVATLLNFDPAGLSLSRLTWLQPSPNGAARPRFFGGIVSRISSG